MRATFFLFLSIAFFVGCSTKKPLKQTPPFKILIAPKIQKLPKQELLTKANEGNINAMVLLHKQYSFPETKEGFESYKKYYPRVLQSNNTKDIFAFAKIYKRYREMFINGDQKYLALLEKASVNEREALFELLEYYSDYRHSDYTKAQQIIDTLLVGATKAELHKLFKIYHENCYYRNDIEPLAQSMKDKNIYVPHYYLLKQRSVKKNQQKFEKLLSEMILAKDKVDIVQTANYFKSSKQKVSLKLYKEAINIDKNDASLYIAMADIYVKLKDLKSAKLYLKNGVKLGSANAKTKLLHLLSKNKKSQKEEYLEFKSLLLKSASGQKIYAKYNIYKKQKESLSSQILNFLANNGDKESIVLLAMNQYRNCCSYAMSSKLKENSKQWYTYILKSNDPVLIAQLYNELRDTESGISAQQLEDIFYILKKLDMQKKNIQVLKDIYNHDKHRGHSLKYAFEEEAAVLGDTKSRHIVSDYFLNTYVWNNKTGTKKGIKLYEKLVEDGDLKAMRTLGKFYLDRYTGFKDIDKAFYYYQKLAKQGSGKKILQLICQSYLCTEDLCSKNEKPNYKKAFFYLNILANRGDKGAMHTIGVLYEKGYGVKRDIQKAQEWYKKAK